MIVEKKKIFNNKIFELNHNLTYHTIDTKIAKITIIENFYQDICSVLSEIDKLPMTLIHDNANNNLNYFDARKCYHQNMTGTEIPYTNELVKLVSKIIEYPEEYIGIEKNILINCFKFTDNITFDLSKYYYNIHYDSFKENQKGQIALVLFLNEHYEDGEGINFYMPLDIDKTSKNGFFNKEEVEINYFLQGKCNRAVLFDCGMLHGQHTPTDQFKNEMRYTQVIFFPIF